MRVGIDFEFDQFVKKLLQYRQARRTLHAGCLAVKVNQLWFISNRRNQETVVET